MSLTPQEIAEKEDCFESWLMDFDAFLAEWRATLSPDVNAALDGSAESLNVLEGHLLTTYADVSAIKADEAGSKAHNAAAIYYGETLRGLIGGKWVIRLDDPNYAFHAVPILDHGAGGSDLCPMAHITTAIDRRKGTFLSDRLAVLQKRLGNAG